MIRPLACILAATLAAGPALAQPPGPAPAAELPHDRGYDKHTSKHDAIDAREQPVTQSLNRSVERATGERDAAGGAAHVRDRVRYEEDMAAYSAALAARQRRDDRDDAYYARQRAAYADAMEAWHWQVEDCERGILRACKRPTPDPADFF